MVNPLTYRILDAGIGALEQKLRHKTRMLRTESAPRWVAMAQQLASIAYRDNTLERDEQ